MINAKQARELANENKDEKIEAAMEKIHKCITKFAGEGLRCCQIFFRPDNLTEPQFDTIIIRLREEDKFRVYRAGDIVDREQGVRARIKVEW